jgi:hypothetical protein
MLGIIKRVGKQHNMPCLCTFRDPDSATGASLSGSHIFMIVAIVIASVVVLLAVVYGFRRAKKTEQVFSWFFFSSSWLVLCLAVCL